MTTTNDGSECQMTARPRCNWHDLTDFNTHAYYNSWLVTLCIRFILNLFLKKEKEKTINNQNTNFELIFFFLLVCRIFSETNDKRPLNPRIHIVAVKQKPRVSKQYFAGPRTPSLRCLCHWHPSWTCVWWTSVRTRSPVWPGRARRP